MLGFLKTRGPVCPEEIDGTKAINLAINDKTLKVFDCNKNGMYSGIVPDYDYLGRESFSYYFTCSSDFKEIEFVHIYDRGEGCEEDVLEINEEKKLLIIGKCLLYKYSQKVGI